MGMSLNQGGRKNKQRARPDMNVTPLVDVVLVLLIIFMVVTPIAMKQFWLHVPQKEEEPRPERNKDSDPPAVLTIDLDRTLRINREPIDREELTERLPRIFAASGDTVLIFDANEGVPFGYAVEIMDLARASGALTIAVSSRELR